MPVEAQHRQQVAHNEAFIAAFDLDTTPFLDWAVTAIFYTALHEVDAYFARLGIHPVNHAQREHFIYLHLLPIGFHYRRLKRYSLDARYKVRHLDPATAFTPSQVRLMLATHLAAIRHYIASLPYP